MSTRENGLTAAALPHRSREYVAALATAVCVAELLLAPLTLVLTLVLASAGRLTRWRLHWLAVPASAGLVLAATRGLSAVTAGYLAWPHRLAAGFAGPGAHGRLLILAARDLPGQLPLALLAATAQAGAVGWLGRRAGGWPASPRPGLMTAVRGRRAAALLAAGQIVTPDGCALGIDPGTGRRAGLSWAEAGLGVLACGADLAAVTCVCLPLACAALRRRKAVVVADLSGGSRVPGAVRALAAAAGIPVADLAAAGAPRLPAALGQALRQRAAIVGAGDRATVTGLTGVLASLAGLGLRTDALAWIHGCERAAPDALRALIAAGRQAGCTVLLSTADQIMADTLASAAGVALVAGPFPRRELAAQPAGTFAILTASRREPGLVAVPVRPAGPP